MHSTIRPVFKRRWIPVAIAFAITLLCTLFALTAKATASEDGCQPRASARHGKYKRAVPKCTAQMAAKRSTGGDTKSWSAKATDSSERVAIATALANGPGKNQ